MASYTTKLDFQVAIELCELCQEEEANYFCKDCQENMCLGCKTAHIRSRASRNHNVVCSSLGKSDKKHRKPIKCKTHPRENIQMYCTTCDEAACHKCIADIKHKNHSFEELETTLDKYKGDLSKHVSEIRQQISEIQKSLHNMDVNGEEYIKESDKTIDGINKQRNQIKSNVDNIADNMVDKVQKRREQDLQLFEKERKNIQKILTQQNQYLESCEDTLKSIDNISDIQRQINKSTKLTLPSITHINPPRFEGDETMSLHHIFGKLVDIQDDLSSNQKASGDKVQKNKTISDGRADSSSVDDVSIDVVSKIKPDISSLCVSAVNDKEAWCGGYNDLVLIDIHGHVKKRINLDNYLCSVAVTSAEEILVSEFKSNIIKRYLSDKKRVNIANTGPYGTKGLFATLQGDILVCLYNSKDDNKVVRITTTGYIKQTIQVDKQQHSLFTYPWDVAENINGDVVVVDGLYMSTIVVTNKEGELKFKYPPSVQSSYTINRCYGIACDNTGCILISDYGNNRIHQIDIDGRFIQFVLSEQHGIQWPRELSIDNKGQLWLCKENGDEVVVYKYRS